MADGNIVYQGAASEAPNYFKSISFTMPNFCNPADRYMQILSVADLRNLEKNMRKLKYLKENYQERIGKNVEQD